MTMLEINSSFSERYDKFNSSAKTIYNSLLSAIINNENTIEMWKSLPTEIIDFDLAIPEHECCYPLSNTPTNYLVTIGDSFSFYAMCALDSLSLLRIPGVCIHFGSEFRDKLTIDSINRDDLFVRIPKATTGSCIASCSCKYITFTSINEPDDALIISLKEATEISNRLFESNIDCIVNLIK